ncbi:uncharacterized protein LOC114122559 [Aphis gossypii]|uniref:uncharacterized protein LOC114122559 n=1 Tax=Aphis gossypii TaxID=80765 RepID=UPI00100E6559|nr:uncharacterized protein LOC114122559 [Aphis gossypii]
MQYIIAYLLITGATFQIAQSAEDQLQTELWILSNLSKSFSWIENFAKKATNDIVNLPNNIKNTIQNIMTVSAITNPEMIDNNVARVQIYTSKIIPSQESVTEIIEKEIELPQQLVTNNEEITIPSSNIIYSMMSPEIIETNTKQEIMPLQVSETEMNIVIPQT